MSIYSIPPLIGGIAVVLLSLFVFAKNARAVVNSTFLLFGMSVAAWLLSYTAAYSVKDTNAAVLCAKIACTAVIFTSSTWYHFTAAFLGMRKELKWVYCSYALNFILFLYFINTRYFLDGVYKYHWGFYSKAGPLHPVFLVIFYIIYGRAAYILFTAWKNQHTIESSHRMNQIKYVMVAFFVAAISHIDFIPKYGVQFYPFGFIFMVAFVFVVAYAIVRHQLMDIEVIIKKTLVFAGLLASTLAIIILPTLILQEYLFINAGAKERAIGLIMSGLIIILSVRKIEDFLVNLTDRYLFQKRYDYKELLKTFTSEVLTVLNLDKLVNLTIDTLVGSVKLTSCAVMLFDDEKQRFAVAASSNIQDSSVTMAKPDSIVAFLEQTHGYLLRKEFIDKNIYIPGEIRKIIDRLNSELMIPMVLQDKVIGVLSLGKKKSDEDFTQDDLDILLPLSRTLAIAISNAELFEELGKTQAEAAQKEKMAVIGTLSAGINHEICNPLGIARGQCEAFLLNVKDGLYKNKTSDELLRKAEEIMAKVIKETDRATAITKKLSGFAKPAKGEAEPVDINKEIDEVFGLVGYELRLEKIEFEKQIEAELPKIVVDRKQFQEVLFNLIRNAGQAIGEKGKIVVAATRTAGKITIDVRDTGSGIPEDKIKELFNPFFTTKEPGKGTGLGLFIVRQVVEKNGGRIYLKKTRVGEGTVFSVEFPEAAVPAQHTVKA